MARLREPHGLRAALSDADVTQAQLSRWVGCNVDKVSNLTRGRIKECDPTLALAIEEALGLYPGALFVLGDLPFEQVPTGAPGQRQAS
jgi:hypothetical protein